MPHLFWEDIFDFMMDIVYHFGYVPKFGMNWEVDFEKDMYVEDEKNFEDFELHTLFGVI